MRLLISLFKYFPYGGLQRDSKRFALAAAAAGHQVLWVVSSWEGEAKPPAESGIAVLECGDIGGVTNTARMDAFGQYVKTLIDGGGCDVSLAMNRLPGHDFYFAADACQKKFIGMQHSKAMTALNPRYRAIIRQENAIASPEAKTTIFTIAEFQKGDFQEMYHTPDDRFIELPPGIDAAMDFPGEEPAAEIRQNMRAELELDDDAVMVVQVGNGSLRKGIDRSVLAMAALNETLRRRCRLYVIGNNDPSFIAACARQAGLPQENIIVVPPSNRIHDYLLAADVMIHPSRSEGAPTVIAEALANRLPVICTDICGFYTRVQAAGGKVIPMPFDQERLNSALSEMIQNLPVHRSAVADYAIRQNFQARAAFAVTVMEQFADGKKTEKFFPVQSMVPFRNRSWMGICSPEILWDCANADELCNALLENRLQGVRLCHYRAMGDFMARSGIHCFLKLLWGCGDALGNIWNALKWFLRPSKVMAVAKNCAEAQRNGIRCAQVLLAARSRRWLWKHPRDIIITRAAPGVQASQIIHSKSTDSHKALRLIAEAVAQMHLKQFVHGDCLSGNIFVDIEQGRVCFIDNDRTRRVCRWRIKSQGRRNLIQFLSRAHLSEDEAVFFLKCYAGEVHWPEVQTTPWIDYVMTAIKRRQAKIEAEDRKMMNANN